MSGTRVVVFIDYQNVYHRARGSFGYESNPDPNLGHVSPLKVGDLLCGLGYSKDRNRIVTGVRVYCGKPDHRSGTSLVRFTSRQMAAWESTAGVTVKARPLVYHEVQKGGRKSKWRAQEKGVDVMLALDISIGARTDVYDVAVVFSADTDLTPALEDAANFGKRIETSTWRGPFSNRGPLQVTGHSLWNHYLDQTHFDLVRDDTDYLAAS